MHPETPAAVYAATTTQPETPAGVFAAISAHPMTPERDLCGDKDAPLGTDGDVYDDSTRHCGRTPTYVVTSMHPPVPVPVYLTTVPQAVGPSGMFEQMFELLEGGRGDFGDVLQSLAELGWPGVTIRDVPNVPKLCEENRKEHHCSDEAAR